MGYVPHRLPPPDPRLMGEPTARTNGTYGTPEGWGLMFSLAALVMVVALRVAGAV